MYSEHKILIFAIIAALLAVVSIAAYNIYDSTTRTNAYRECVEANKVIVEMITRKDSESLRVTSIPSCSMR